MNTRPPIEASHGPTVLSVAFNNDTSRFSIGLDTGLSGKCIYQSCVPPTHALLLMARSLPHIDMYSQLDP